MDSEPTVFDRNQIGKAILTELDLIISANVDIINGCSDFLSLPREQTAAVRSMMLDKNKSIKSVKLHAQKAAQKLRDELGEFQPDDVEAEQRFQRSFSQEFFGKFFQDIPPGGLF